VAPTTPRVVCVLPSRASSRSPRWGPVRRGGPVVVLSSSSTRSSTSCCPCRGRPSSCRDVAEEAPVDPSCLTPWSRSSWRRRALLSRHSWERSTALSATVLPPQAARTTAPAAAEQRHDRLRAHRLTLRADPCDARTWAVVEVALGELLAPGPETQVLHRPGSSSATARAAAAADHLKRLTGLASCRCVGIGLDDHLAPARGRAA